jgi:CRP/FNR family cyclic AMP-dependent transcriptional regulator
MATSETAQRAQRIHVLDALPGLGEGLSPDQERVARRHAMATVLRLTPGAWQPQRPIDPERGQLGLLVLDGLLTRNVVMGEILATELVGRGDILRPSDHDGEDAPVPFDVAWHVLEPARIAVLDRRFTQVVGHWPELQDALMSCAIGRAHSLAVTLAVSHLRRVDVRLLVMMWYLADRWGTVRPEGVHVPLRLTHQTLGRLVGAQRPSVTTALKQLADEGSLTRLRDQSWLLHGDPPGMLARPRSETAPAHK